MEWLMVPIKGGVAAVSKDKLNGAAIKVVDLTDDETSLEEDVLRAFSRPTSATTRYLCVPMNEARIVELKPTVESKVNEFESYKSL